MNKSRSHNHESNHHGHEHGHSHGVIDSSITTNDRGLWAVKWSFIILALTCLFQVIVFYFSHSVALLADAIHNIGDATTAIPLAIAFTLGKLKPNKRFTYGYGRIEDLAGLFVILTVFVSGVVAGYEAIHRFFHPEIVKSLKAVMLAALIGFIGNEVVAVFRIKVGKEINSAALIADGYHARMDGFTSLAVLFGALGVSMGYPLADPIIGVLITLTILKIVWDSTKVVFVRLLDGVEPELIEELKHSARHVKEVLDVSEVRARWIGHNVHAELNIAVSPNISVEKGHEIAKAVKCQIMKHLPYISNAIIHVDPVNASGEQHHGH